jgi:hypothetical protein
MKVKGYMFVDLCLIPSWRFDIWNNNLAVVSSSRTRLNSVRPWVSWGFLATRVMVISFVFTEMASILSHKGFRQSSFHPCLLPFQISCAHFLDLNIC